MLVVFANQVVVPFKKQSHLKNTISTHRNEMLIKFGAKSVHCQKVKTEKGLLIENSLQVMST